MTSCKSICSWQSVIILWCVSQSRDVSHDWRALNFFFKRFNCLMLRFWSCFRYIHVYILIICEFNKIQLCDFLSENPVRARAPQLAVLTITLTASTGTFHDNPLQTSKCHGSGPFRSLISRLMHVWWFSLETVDVISRVALAWQQANICNKK